MKITATEALTRLVIRLGELGYQFTTVTPDTHALVLARFGQRPARSLRDVFGWNCPFDPAILPPGLFELLQAADGCEPSPETDLWRAKLRIASVLDLLFVHSAFPTLQRDAVFFGPDSYRFVRAIRQLRPRAKRAVDIGCGTGVGGIVLSRAGCVQAPVVLSDVNEAALGLARVNAALAGVAAEVVKSDVLSGVPGDVDLIIANPAYLRDEQARTYRDGGGQYGAALSARIVREALARLGRNRDGGTLLLYTGAAIVDGKDTFFETIREALQHEGAHYRYEELDPDVFSSELTRDAYADAERIAAVLLQVRVG